MATWPLTWIPLGLMLAGFVLLIWRAKRALARFLDAYDRADVEAMRRQIKILEPYTKPVQRAFMQIAILEAQELWSAAQPRQLSRHARRRRCS